MKRSLVFVFVAAMAGLSFAQGHAQEKEGQSTKKVKVGQRTPEKQPQKEQRTVKFSMDMITSGRVTPGYKGSPLSQLVDVIGTKTLAVKGEFESASDFNARKAAAISGNLLGDSSWEDMFAFVLPVEAKKDLLPRGISYSFNPDTSVVSLYVLPDASAVNGIGAPDYGSNKRRGEGFDKFDIDFKVNSKSIYQARNAFGATINVEEVSSTNLGIAVNRIPFLSFKREGMYLNPSPAVNFVMANEMAAKVLPSLKALLVMKLADPYVIYNFYYIKPTASSPRESSNSSKYLAGHLVGIVFYSDLTGEIIARLPDNFGRSELDTGRAVEKVTPPVDDEGVRLITESDWRRVLSWVEPAAKPLTEVAMALTRSGYKLEEAGNLREATFSYWQANNLYKYVALRFQSEIPYKTYSIYNETYSSLTRALLSEGKITQSDIDQSIANIDRVLRSR